MFLVDHRRTDSRRAALCLGSEAMAPLPLRFFIVKSQPLIDMTGGSNRTQARSHQRCASAVIVVRGRPSARTGTSARIRGPFFVTLHLPDPVKCLATVWAGMITGMPLPRAQLRRLAQTNRPAGSFFPVCLWAHKGLLE